MHRRKHTLTLNPKAEKVAVKILPNHSTFKSQPPKGTVVINSFLNCWEQIRKTREQLKKTRFRLYFGTHNGKTMISYNTQQRHLKLAEFNINFGQFSQYKNQTHHGIFSPRSRKPPNSAVHIEVLQYHSHHRKSEFCDMKVHSAVDRDRRKENMPDRLNAALWKHCRPVCCPAKRIWHQTRWLN